MYTSVVLIILRNIEVGIKQGSIDIKLTRDMLKVGFIKQISSRDFITQIITEVRFEHFLDSIGDFFNPNFTILLIINCFFILEEIPW